MKSIFAAAIALVLIVCSCVTAPKEEAQTFEYWTFTKKAYLNINNLLSNDENTKKDALQQYALLVPSSKERTHIFLARSLSQKKTKQERNSVFEALKSLSAGGYVIPHLIRAYADNKEAGAEIMEYIKSFNPADFNRGEIGALMYSEDKDLKYFSAQVLAMTGRAAASAFPDILKFAFEPGAAYEEYSSYVDIALAVNNRAARENDF